jgi:rRNA processing protein Krr1/Pno1
MKTAEPKARLTAYERELRRVLRVLIEKSDGIIEAIDLSTDQFAVETAQLSQAASAAEKVLRRANGRVTR